MTNEIKPIKTWNASGRMRALQKVLRRQGWVVDQRETTAGTYRLWMYLNKKHPMRVDPDTNQRLKSIELTQTELIAAITAEGLDAKLGEPGDGLEWVRSRHWSICLQNFKTGGICVTCIRNTPAGELVRQGYDA